MRLVPERPDGPSAQHGNKAPEEDDLAPALEKEVLPQFEPAFFQANVAPVATQNPRLSPKIAPLVAARMTRGMDNWWVVPAKTAATSSIVSLGKGMSVLSMAKKR